MPCTRTFQLEQTGAALRRSHQKYCGIDVFCTGKSWFARQPNRKKRRREDGGWSTVGCRLWRGTKAVGVIGASLAADVAVQCITTAAFLQIWGAASRSSWGTHSEDTHTKTGIVDLDWQAVASARSVGTLGSFAHPVSARPDRRSKAQCWHGCTP